MEILYVVHNNGLTVLEKLNNKKLTLSLSYYNDFEHSHNHFNVWSKYMEKINIQIIDDGSKRDCINY